MSDEGVEYVFAHVARWREEGCRATFSPRTLREALPNRTYTLPGKTTFSYSDVAVIGRVTGAVKGPAYAHLGEVLVPAVFDDPGAVERAVDVHVDVDESFGSATPVPRLAFRVGLGGAQESSLFIDGLGSLGRVVVVLERRDDRDGEALIPAEHCALLGVVHGADRLRFPGLGREEDDFVDGVRTVAQFRAAASSPQTTIVLDDPDT